MKCPKCSAEIPDVSRFCLSCGNPVPPPATVAVQEPADPDPNGFAMLFFGLSFMMFFFSLVPMFLGLWVGMLIMVGVGMALVGIGVHMIRSNKRAIETAKQEAAIRVKCRYCGSLNDPKAERCASCGATL
ncbi:MAG: zinc ribbon domain-containing protein [Thermoplasmata archaeon]|jgi:hypothetical protein|nr:zinc ribbon domain-containing protein [Thermoplasmata archaeon]